MLSLSSKMSEILCSAVVSVRERTETRNTTKVLVNHLFLKLICDVSIQIVRSSHSRHSLAYVYRCIFDHTSKVQCVTIRLESVAHARTPREY